MGFLSVLCSLSAPWRAQPVGPCGPALPFSVCPIWISSVIEFFSFSALLLAGHLRAGAHVLLWRPLRGSRNKSRLFRLIFSGDRNPEGRRSRKPSLRPQGARVFAPAVPARTGRQKRELTEESRAGSR